MNLEQGDPFEKTHAAWIRESLPGTRGIGYEQVWRDFIGNNGKSVPLAIEGLDEKTTALRQKFVEGHYSMAVSAFMFDRVAARMAAIEGKRSTVDEYLRDIENYAGFISYLGHVCDMVGLMDEGVKGSGSIHEHVIELHRLRSNAIHASRIPMQQDYEDLRIPIISRRRDPLPGEWHEKSNWNDVDLAKNYTYLSQFAKETRDDLFVALSKAYPEIHRSADKLFKKKRVEPPIWPPPAAPQAAPSYSVNPRASGVRGN